MHATTDQSVVVHPLKYLTEIEIAEKLTFRGDHVYVGRPVKLSSDLTYFSGEVFIVVNQFLLSERAANKHVSTVQAKEIFFVLIERDMTSSFASYQLAADNAQSMQNNTVV